MFAGGGAAGGGGGGAPASSAAAAAPALGRNGAATTSVAPVKTVPPNAPARPASRVSSIAFLVVGSAPPATCSITF